MKISRLNFIRTLAGTVAAAAVSSFTSSAAFANKVVEAGKKAVRKNWWGMGIDIDKCIGCGRCADACKNENSVSREPFYFRTWIERYILRKNGKAEVESPNGGIDGFTPPSSPKTIRKSFFVPKICNHCEESPCVQVCPVGASFITADGVVLVDQKYCIGCRYCIQACPYGCRYFNTKLGVAEKCTLCYHRLKRGKRPACVEVCPTGARIFGDLDDAASPLNKFIDTHHIGVLKPYLGTRPKVRYSGLEEEVR